MRNIDFTDIHKFIVSIGLALVFLALLIPWLFFREKFDLLLKVDELSELTSAAQKIIIYKQRILLTVLQTLPYFSIVLFVVGISLIIFGLFKWGAKQKVFDEHQEILLSKTKRELEVMTPEEKYINTMRETKEIEDEQKIKTTKRPILNNSNVNYYKMKGEKIVKSIGIEEKILEKVRKTYSTYYTIKPNMKIVNKQKNVVKSIQAFDIIMSSKTKEDIIVEIKYSREINIFILERIVSQLEVLSNNYSNYANKEPTAKIIIVLPDFVYEEVISDNNLLEYINKKSIDIIIVNEESLNDLNGDFLKILSE